jgi:hypothetical protein
MKQVSVGVSELRVFYREAVPARFVVGWGRRWVARRRTPLSPIPRAVRFLVEGSTGPHQETNHAGNDPDRETE